MDIHTGLRGNALFRSIFPLFVSLVFFVFHPRLIVVTFPLKCAPPMYFSRMHFPRDAVDGTTCRVNECVIEKTSPGFLSHTEPKHQRILPCSINIDVSTKWTRARNEDAHFDEHLGYLLSPDRKTKSRVAKSPNARSSKHVILFSSITFRHSRFLTAALNYSQLSQFTIGRNVRRYHLCYAFQPCIFIDSSAQQTRP